MGGMVATIQPQFSAGKDRPIVDTRSFFSSSDFVLMGVAATLALVLLSLVGERKTRVYVKRRKRRARRRAIAYHRGQLRTLTRMGRPRKRARVIGGGGGISRDTPVKFGKGAPVPFSSLPKSLQKQMRLAS